MQKLELPDHCPVTEEVHGTSLGRFISRLKKIGRAHKHDFIVIDTPGGVQHLNLIVHGMADSANILAYSALSENGRAIRSHEMQKLLLGYRDNMRVEVEAGIAVSAKTVADLRALTAWPDGLALNIHVDLDPRFSVVRVERAASVVQAS